MDIREAIEATGAEVKGEEPEIKVCCPFCIEEGEISLDERFRLGINTEDGRMYCFNCGKKSNDLEYTIQELQRILDTGDIETAQKRRKHKKKRRVMLPEGFQLLESPNGDSWNNKAWRYIRKRGVTEKQIKEKQIGYTLIGEHHHRIVAPIYRHQHLLGFVGRDMTDQMELKYMNSYGDKAIYNLPDKSHHKSICLSEGFFDALAIERGSLKLGIDSGALLGHDIKDDQLELLLHSGYKYFFLWLDPDEAGVKGIIKISKKIPSDKHVRIVLPKGFKDEGANDKDPSELESNDIKHRLEGAKRYTPELLDRLRVWMAFDE